jgi:DNA protecting protein DprA
MHESNTHMNGLSTREVAVLIRLSNAPGVGARTLSRSLETLNAGGHEIEFLPDWSSADLQSQLNLSEQAAKAFVAGGVEAEEIAAQLHDAGVAAFTSTSSGYPAQLSRVLGKQAPPVLFMSGNIELVDTFGIGICGSRDCSPQGLEATSSLTVALAGAGVNVISGYAKGVDTAAHRSSLQSKGTTTIVLGEGILRFTPKPDLRDFITGNNCLVISEFHPTSRWSIGNAMTRNRTICALAEAMVVIEAGLTGGTYAAGEEALRVGRHLFVLEYDCPPESAAGNTALLAKGGHSLRIHDNGSLDVPALMSFVHLHQQASSARNTQRTFEWP